jgi:FAD/FMN-containing dehydrogenase
MARDTSAVGFVTVDTLGDLTAIIQKAAPGTQVRVRGAMHSVPAAIVTDPSNGVDVMLGKDFLTVEALNPSPGTLVRVGGGRRLGGDPEEGVDITDGLLYWLANAAQGPWSMTDLGGISHQTVGGFLATGSSGGSLSFSLEDQIQAIHLVDGTGTLRVIDRDLQPEDFAAVGVSMGLFGVIVAVDFLPVDRFAIVGTE